MEKALLDYDGEVNKDVNFQLKPDNSGINLKGFSLDGIEQIVEEVLQYRPWNFGMVNPGAGQLGIYRLKGLDNQEKFALVKDYRSAEGDWRIFLINITQTEKEMKDALVVDENYGLVFMDYLF